MEEADDGTDSPPLERDGVDGMLRELFPDLDLAMVKRVLGLELNPERDNPAEDR
jgi:hypothetical protein